MRDGAAPTRHRRRRRWIALPLAALVASLLGACATPVPGPVLRDSEKISGRLALRVAAQDKAPERAVNIAFDLRGRPEAGQIDLSTPLGSIVAQARWSPAEVLLITPQGQRRFDDLDDLSREVLGEAIPVAALFDWLQGRPWPGAGAQPDAAGRGFSQLGWHVDLSRFAESQVIARREQAPAVTVRAVLERP